MTKDLPNPLTHQNLEKIIKSAPVIDIVKNVRTDDSRAHKLWEIICYCRLDGTEETEKAYRLLMKKRLYKWNRDVFSPYERFIRMENSQGIKQPYIVLNDILEPMEGEVKRKETMTGNPMEEEVLKIKLGEMYKYLKEDMEKMKPKILSVLN